MDNPHISALRDKHDALKARIASEMSRPLPDMGILAALKKPADTPEPPTLSASEVNGATIESMVDGLAARLAADPGDRDGWIRLMRSNVVLGRGDKASAALADARKTFAGNAEALAAIEAAAAELGIAKPEGQ